MSRYPSHRLSDIQSKTEKLSTATQKIGLKASLTNPDMKRRRWQWIGHVLRMLLTAIVRTALRWTPDGKRVKEDRKKPGEEQWSEK